MVYCYAVLSVVIDLVLLEVIVGAEMSEIYSVMIIFCDNVMSDEVVVAV